MTPSTSFQQSNNSIEGAVVNKTYRKLSDVSCSRITENLNETNNDFDMDADTFGNQSPGLATNSNSKTTILKDFSKKFLKRVNSGNQSYYNNLKKNFSKSTNKLRRNNDMNSSNNSENNTEKENQRVDSTSSIGHLFNAEEGLNGAASNALSSEAIIPAGSTSKSGNNSRHNWRMGITSNTNSIDRHFKYPNSDNLSITGKFLLYFC